MTDTDHRLSIKAAEADRLLHLVRQLYEETFSRPLNHPLTLESRIEEDLSLDSLTRIELLMRIQREFNCELPEQAALSAVTLADLLRVLFPEKIEPLIAAGSFVSAAHEAADASLPQEPLSLLDVLSFHAERHKAKPHIFLEAEGEGTDVISFGELKTQAQSLAASLMKKNLEPGQTVALMLPTSREFFSSFLGVMIAGGIPVPIYPPHRHDQLEQHMDQYRAVLKNAAVKYLLTGAEASSVSSFIKSDQPSLREVLVAAELTSNSSPRAIPRVSADALAFLQYTSGSTGNPKGVTIAHSALLHNIRAMGKSVSAGPEDIFVSWLPLYHDMGLIGAWLGSLYFGGRFVVMPPISFMVRPARWLKAIHRHRGTLSAAPNFAYEICASRLSDRELEGLDLSSWRVAFNGAEPVSPGTLARFSERFSAYGFCPQAMAPVYGLAENCVGLCFPPLGRKPRIDRIDRDALQRTGKAAKVEDERTADVCEIAGCGLPIPHHEIRVVNKSGRELGEREEGRIQFCGPSSTKGYYDNPEANAKLFDGQWLNTGDCGYLADGEIFITGRIKDMIIRGGRNIYPQELEQAVAGIPGIRQGCVAVFASRNPEQEVEQLIVAAETKERDEAKREELRELIRSAALRIISMPPDEILLIPPKSIPKTSSGKVRRSAARDLFENGKLAAGHSHPLPRVHARRKSTIPVSERRFHRMGESLYSAYCYLIFGSLGLITWCLVISCPGLALRRWIAKQAARLAALLTNTKITASGLELLTGEKPCIVVSNHASYLDSLVLFSALPPRFSYVAKRELSHNVFLSLTLKRLGTLFVERFDLERGIADREGIAAAVRSGQSIVMFPEGTFVRAPGLTPFRLGAFSIAAQVGVPVVPVAIRGTRSALRAGQWFFRKSDIRVTVLPLIQPQGDDWNTVLSLRDQARKAILKHCGEPEVK